MIYRKVTERGHRNPMLPNSSILAGMPCKCITKIVVRSIQNMLRFIYHTFNHTFTYHLIHVENTLRIKFGISYLTFNQIDRGQLLYLNIYIYIYILLEYFIEYCSQMGYLAECYMLYPLSPKNFYDFKPYNFISNIHKQLTIKAFMLGNF